MAYILVYVDSYTFNETYDQMHVQLTTFSGHNLGTRYRGTFDVDFSASRDDIKESAIIKARAILAAHAGAAEDGDIMRLIFSPWDFFDVPVTPPDPPPLLDHGGEA